LLGCSVAVIVAVVETICALVRFTTFVASALLELIARSPDDRDRWRQRQESMLHTPHMSSCTLPHSHHPTTLRICLRQRLTELLALSRLTPFSKILHAVNSGSPLCYKLIVLGSDDLWINAHLRRDLLVQDPDYDHSAAEQHVASISRTITHKTIVLLLSLISQAIFTCPTATTSAQSVLRISLVPTLPNHAHSKEHTSCLPDETPQMHSTTKDCAEEVCGDGWCSQGTKAFQWGQRESKNVPRSTLTD